MHLSHPRRFPLFVLASSVCWSLQCLIFALTQVGGGGHFFRLTCSVVLWGGRDAENKQHWCVLAVSWPHLVCPCSWRVCFPSLHCLGSRLLCWELSEAGPGLYTLPGSRPLRFRYSTKVQTQLGLRFVPFPGGSEVKASACNAGDLSSIPGSGRSPGEGNGNPLQYSCLENLMDGGAWWATVHRVAKNQTRLSSFTFFHFQVRAAQVTRCLASMVAAKLIASPVPAAVFWVYNWRTFSGRCGQFRIPRSLG